LPSIFDSLYRDRSLRGISKPVRSSFLVSSLWFLSISPALFDRASNIVRCRAFAAIQENRGESQMQLAKNLLLYFVSILLVCAAVTAQQSAIPLTSADVPRLVNFSGKATDAEGGPSRALLALRFRSTTCSMKALHSGWRRRTSLWTRRATTRFNSVRPPLRACRRVCLPPARRAGWGAHQRRRRTTASVAAQRPLCAESRRCANARWIASFGIPSCWCGECGRDPEQCCHVTVPDFSGNFFGCHYQWWHGQYASAVHR
jgi:hypothetical protein